jgi:hypothetical protein
MRGKPKDDQAPTPGIDDERDKTLSEGTPALCSPATPGRATPRYQTFRHVADQMRGR